jgi:zinc D-Ala-D-Ala carboxypeptidase
MNVSAASTHFSLAEFTHSDTAVRLQIDNTLPLHLVPLAEQTLLMLERIRAFLSELAGRDVPMNLSSGYRCLALNWAVKSSSSSDHVIACAADWTAPRFGTSFEVCKALQPHMRELGIHQLIHEFGAWIHTSTRFTSAINEVITISHSGTQRGIVAV